MTKGKAAAYLILSGLIIGFIGEHSTGYLAAMAIPKEYFQWFDQNLSLEIGLTLVSVVEQFLGLGILGLIAGYLMRHYSPLNWITNTIICYSAFIFYFIALIPLFHGTEFYNPLVGQSFFRLLPMTILPISIGVASYVSEVRYK